MSVITVKPGSRELVEAWAPGRGIGDYVASAAIDGRKPEGNAVGFVIKLKQKRHRN